MTKFSAMNSGGEEYRYGAYYEVESGENRKRLIVGTNGEQVALLDRLSAGWRDPEYFVLYVSLASHTGKPSGRYQSPVLTRDDMLVFLYMNERVLEGFGGQHTWIGNPSGEGLLVLDNHNLIYAYGTIDQYIELLKKEGYEQGSCLIPHPHTHHFASGFAKDEFDLFRYFEWNYSPLSESDE